MAEADAKKLFLLTAELADQEALLAPEPEPVPAGEWAAALRDAYRHEAPWQRGPTPAPAPPPAMHPFVVDPSSHPAWGDVVARALELGLAPWQAQMDFRLALLALHGEDAASRNAAIARLCLELDAHLRPPSTLMVGPARLDAPGASPIAAPRVPGVALFAGLELPEAPPERIVSLIAALVGAAAWHAPAVEVYGPELDAAPLDLVVATAEALDRDVRWTPVPALPLPLPATSEAELVALLDGALVHALAAARRLAADAPEVAIVRLPEAIRAAPTPAARLALMQSFALATRAVHALPMPPPDAPGLLAQIAARLASPLAAVRATSHAELARITSFGALGERGAAALGLDLPTRFPGWLAEAKAALRGKRPVPRWTVANMQGADRALVCATLLGRLPSADQHLLEALVGLAPPELEPALHEMVREPWVDPVARAAALAWLVRLGQAAP